MKTPELTPLGQENGNITIKGKNVVYLILFFFFSLPHEWEWQYVAQAGKEYRTYPWGSTWDDAVVPESYTGRERLYPDHPPADVNAFPGGRSPFGVYDLIGNVWQWTDVYQDEHSRAGKRS